MNESATMTDHDLLIRIDERVRAIHERLDGMDVWVVAHERDHKNRGKVIGSVAAALGAVAGFFTSLFTK